MTRTDTQTHEDVASVIWHRSEPRATGRLKTGEGLQWSAHSARWEVVKGEGSHTFSHEHEAGGAKYQSGNERIKVQDQ